MNKIGVAVVGLGNIGKVHARTVRELNGCRLVAVVDQISTVAEQLARELGAVPYSTLDNALRNPEVDVVIIATPSYMHSPQAILSMEMGKDVIVEKPMSTTISGAREMVGRARKLGRKLGVVYQERYAKDVRRLKEMMDSGKLGRPILLESQLSWYRDEVSYYNRDEVARSWRGMWNTEGGGVLTNQGIHTLDLMYWLGGKVREVFGIIGNLTHPSITVEDTAVAVLKFANGSLGSITQTVSAKPPEAQFRRLRVVGSEGQAELLDYSLVEIGVGNVNGKVDTLTQSGGLHRALLEHFMDCYAKGEEFPIDGEEGMKALEIIKAIYLSWSSGRAQSLPLDVSVVV